MAEFPNKSTQFKTGSKQVEIARKGGKASGRAKRKKKTMREMLKAAIESPVTNEKIAAALKREGFEPTYGGMVLHDMIARAGKNGNVGRLMFELLGELGQGKKENGDGEPNKAPIMFTFNREGS